MQQPLISIIVPVYNTKAYLKTCVDSLTAQTYSNLEILLVDDGSTDGTGALCDELAKGDVRIRALHQENAGPSAARNHGLQEAQGEYIGFVDSDDFVEPGMYAELYEAIVRTGFGIAQAGRDEITPTGETLPNICEPVEMETAISPECFLEELLMHRGDCSFCTKLLRRDLFDGKVFPVGVLNEDFRLLVEMLSEGERFVCIPGQMYHVLYRADSNTRKKTSFSRVFADSVDNADYVTTLVEKCFSENQRLLTIALRFGVFQRLEYLLHIPIDEMNRRKGSRDYNEMYANIIRWMRKNFWKSMTNPYLTKKNKFYHLLFAVAPKSVRKVHRRLRAGRNRSEIK